MNRIKWIALGVLTLGLLLPGAAPAETELVAHRGASHLAPENTLAAVKLGWEKGADAVEVDVYLSADGRIVCHHDKTTKRTTGVDRRVDAQTYDELSRLDAGAWKSPDYAGEPIPLLRDVLATIPEGRALLIEIKCGPEIVQPLERLLKEAELPTSKTRVISFSHEVISRVEAAMPELETYWLSSFRQDKDTGRWSPSIPELVRRAEAAGVDGVDVKAAAPVLRAEAVDRIRSAGLSLHAWTVDDPALACRLIGLGFDSITTNRPGWLREQLAGSCPDF